MASTVRASRRGSATRGSASQVSFTSSSKTVGAACSAECRTQLAYLTNAEEMPQIGEVSASRTLERARLAALRSTPPLCCPGRRRPGAAGTAGPIRSADMYIHIDIDTRCVALAPQRR